MLVNQLTSGDIVIFKHHEAPFAPHHTAIVASNPNFMLHADGENVVKTAVADMVAFTNHQPYVYRSSSLEWATEAARIAGGFAALNNTTYGINRARGVKQQTASGVTPPFEFDALYRALKWANRKNLNGAFSANHGTTCSAFVSACFQAARIIRLSSRHNDRVLAAFDYLTANRVDKAATKIARHAERIEVITSGGVRRRVETFFLRDRSNVGIRPGHGNFADHWTETHRLLTASVLGTAAPTIAEFLTPGMAFDAKFIYTPVLQNLLIGDPDSWNASRLTDLDAGFLP